MQTHPKKRLEVIIEAPVAMQLARLMDRHGRGYTMLPVLGGSGRSGPWTRDGQISSAGGMVAFVAVMDDGALPALLADVFQLVERHIGIVSVTDCQVLRAEKF